METTNKQPETPQLNGFQLFLRSHTARFIIVGMIMLVLMIPLAQLFFLIDERKERQNNVTDELKQEWGESVDYYGLVLKVPVTETRQFDETDGKSKTIRTSMRRVGHTGFIFPETASDNIHTLVNEKYRGIFSTQIFTATVHGKATFDLKAIREKNAHLDIDWSHVQVAFITNQDVRFTEISDIVLNDKKLAIESQEPFGNGDDLLVNSTAPFSLDTDKNRLEVSVNTIINGSQSIHYQSLATKSNMTMTSNWNDPAFAGTSLPNNNSVKITEKGFTAGWNNLEINSGRNTLHLDELSRFSRKYTDVRFISMVDHYQLNERTIKYALLVLTLTFAVFFLIQIVGKIYIHPLHYFLIGLALLLFYSLLLSFSEQLGFIPAYLIASVTIVGLITWYAKSILKSLKFALMSAMSLSLLYAFLLVIVNLEVYALIVGSIGLLVVLAAIMSVTRKINFDS